MRVHYLIKYLLSSVLVIGQSSLVLAENTCFVDDNLSATEQIEVEITELVEYTDKEVNALMQQGRHDESTTLLEKIATINSKKKDITESNVGYYLEEIAKIYQSQGNYVKAEELYLQNINYFRQAFTDALERIEKGSLEGNQQIQELLTQVDTLARNPDRLTMQIQRLSQAIETRQFQGRQLNAEQLETLRQQREQVIGLRDLARDPAEFKKRTEELKNQLETQLEERRNEAIKQAKNAIRNIISKNFNHLATLYQSQEKEQEYKFFIDKALTLLREEDFNLSIFTSVANFYVSVGKNKQAMCLSNISQR